MPTGDITSALGAAQPVWSGPSSLRRQRHRHVQIAHAIDLGGREMFGADVDLDRWQQQKRRREPAMERQHGVAMSPNSESVDDLFELHSDMLRRLF
jgi:hypothetical protein